MAQMNWTPLHKAARSADVATLRRLIDAGASLDAVSSTSRTPLFYLCMFTNVPIWRLAVSMDDRVACTKLLIEAGANLEATDNLGRTPLHEVAKDGCPELLSLLIQSGANVNVADADGQTPLIYASSGGCTSCVDALLAAGASVNARSSVHPNSYAGQPPLAVALGRNHRRVWPSLLRAGAEIPHQNYNGEFFWLHPYILRVQDAGGFKKYEQAHLSRITAILAPTPLLPPELVRKVLEFWLHAGYY